MKLENVALIFSILLFIVTFELLRRRTLREKYAAIWIIFSILVLVFVSFPKLLSFVAQTFGFELSSNFLFALLILFLTFVVMQLSAEIGKLESESQRLAEEVALLTKEKNDNEH